MLAACDFYSFEAHNTQYAITIQQQGKSPRISFPHPSTQNEGVDCRAVSRGYVWKCTDRVDQGCSKFYFLTCLQKIYLVKGSLLSWPRNLSYGNRKVGSSIGIGCSACLISFDTHSYQIPISCCVQNEHCRGDLRHYGKLRRV